MLSPLPPPGRAWRSPRGAASAPSRRPSPSPPPPGAARAFSLDLADPEGPGRLADELLEAYGRVDVVLHNAAIRPPTAIGSVTAALWDGVFAVNVRGPLLLSQALLPAMVTAGWGRIVFIGGISSYIGQRERAGVVSSKLAVVGLARRARLRVRRLGGDGERRRARHDRDPRGDAALYGPAGDQSARARNVPMGHLGSIEDVANAALFLASDLARYTTGQELFVAGGAPVFTREGVGT